MPGPPYQIGVLKHPGRSDVRVQDVDIQLIRIAKALVADRLDRDELLEVADLWLDHRLTIAQTLCVKGLESALNPAA